MSILLDALRKSENQKRLGDTPSIHSPEAGLSPVRRSGGGRWVLLLILLAVIVMAWFGWKQYVGNGEESLGATSSSEATSADAVPNTADQGDASPQAQQSPSARAANPARSEASPQAKTVAPPPVSAFTSPVASLPEGPATQTSAQATTREVATPPPEPSTLDLRPEEAPGPGSSTAPEESPSTASEQVGFQPLSFWQLPEDVRNEVGGTRITVLVFDEEPENRFILMNGNRMMEGDQLSNGLELEEVRRDGAIFLFRNYRFIVNR